MREDTLPTPWLSQRESTHRAARPTSEQGEDMQFVLLGYDGKDGDALSRRLAVREQHLAQGDQLVAEGKMLFAAAILDNTEKMIGSMLVLEFPSRTELDAWLEIEPYVRGEVWQEIEIYPAKVSPPFVDRDR
jgi:uncharacterized protein YciI